VDREPVQGLTLCGIWRSGRQEPATRTEKPRNANTGVLRTEAESETARYARLKIRDPPVTKKKLLARPCPRRKGKLLRGQTKRAGRKSNPTRALTRQQMKSKVRAQQHQIGWNNTVDSKIETGGAACLD
jgi:hypothetical protein